MEEQRTLLVVEDEALIRMSTVATLTDAGYRVLEAGDSAEALAILARHDEISVMLTDVRMPGKMDGLALVARVCRDHPAIRSVVVSSNAYADQAGKAGAIGFVAKPFMSHTIVRAIQETIARFCAVPGRPVWNH